jgi:glycosyltransferase involved in cell wall biosynthesis
LRILTISNCPLLEHQGSGYVIMNYARALRERGHEVDLYGPEACELFHGSMQIGKRYRQYLGMALLAGRELRRKDYDVVEFYGAECWLAATLLNRQRRRQFLITLHSNGIEMFAADTLRQHVGFSTLTGRKPRLYQISQDRFLRRAYSRIDGLVTVSLAEAEYARRMKCDGRFGVEGIETPLPESFLGREVNRQKEKLLCYCGSWIPRKGTQVMKEDLTRLLKEFPDWRLLLVGVGKGFDPSTVFPGTVLGQVEVVPYVTEKAELQRLYDRVSILVFPSIHESFGLVIAEAMACGCAPVTTRTGFGAALRDGEEALLMPEARSPRLYEATKRLMTDDALRLRIAAEGYRRVQPLRWVKAAEQIEGVYTRWLARLRGTTAERTNAIPAAPAPGGA